MSEKFDRNVGKFRYMVGNCRKNSTTLMNYFNEDEGKLFRQGGSLVWRHPMWLSEKLLGFCISVYPPKTMLLDLTVPIKQYMLQSLLEKAIFLTKHNKCTAKKSVPTEAKIGLKSPLA